MLILDRLINDRICILSLIMQKLKTSSDPNMKLFGVMLAVVVLVGALVGAVVGVLLPKISTGLSLGVLFSLFIGVVIFNRMNISIET
jgi:hypothetical protein